MFGRAAIRLGIAHILVLVLQLKSKTNPIFELTASTSTSIDVWDISRTSCIRRMSYRCTICSKNTNNISKVSTFNISVIFKANCVSCLAIFHISAKLTKIAKKIKSIDCFFYKRKVRSHEMPHHNGEHSQRILNVFYHCAAARRRTACCVVFAATWRNTTQHAARLRTTKS